jgi:NAD(P)-dependent dehydrogenase (short-subunit alcohol dehydrogenase family)
MPEGSHVQKTSELLHLSPKTALVTGSARGIGRAVALRLADAGAAVVVTDLSQEAVDVVVAEIRANGGRALGHAADVSSGADVEQLIEATIGTFGGIDILINNAALRGWYTWDTLTPEVWDRYMAVNEKAVFFVSQAVARRMVEQKRGGVIVNISSTAAAHPVRWKVDYNAAKAAVANMTRSLAVELGAHGIRVNAVGPGGTNTPGGSGSIPSGFSPEMLRKMGEDWQNRMALKVGLMDPDEIARAVLFFCSDAARCITGQSLYVDGGYLVG